MHGPLVGTVVVEARRNTPDEAPTHRVLERWTRNRYGHPRGGEASHPECGPCSAIQAGVQRRFGEFHSGHTGEIFSGALNAGAHLRDVQDCARHADPKTTMRYDRSLGSSSGGWQPMLRRRHRNRRPSS